MSEAHSVAVLGAAGHTARFVTRELERRGARVLAATRTGRWASGEIDAACRTIDFRDPRSIENALAEADAVINCAGPFLDTAPATAEAAIARGIPYFDVTAEQASVLQLREDLHALAVRAGVGIMPAMGFFGGLTDLLASALADRLGRLEQIETAVALSSWRPTLGTVRTGARNTAERLIVRGGRLVGIPADGLRKSWPFPEPMGVQPVACVPLSEIPLMMQHLGAVEITSYMNTAALDDLRDTTGRLRAHEGDPDQRFALVAKATSLSGAVQEAVAVGTDIYAVTAPLVVTACLEYLKGSQRQGGVLAPGEVFEPAAFLAALAPSITVQLGDSAKA